MVFLSDDAPQSLRDYVEACQHVSCVAVPIELLPSIAYALKGYFVSSDQVLAWLETRPTATLEVRRTLSPEAGPAKIENSFCLVTKDFPFFDVETSCEISDFTGEDVDALGEKMGLSPDVEPLPGYFHLVEPAYVLGEVQTYIFPLDIARRMFNEFVSEMNVLFDEADAKG